MKKNVLVSCGLAIALSLGSGACATGKKETTVEKSRLVTITATVVAIDQATRVVTLKGSQGNTVTFRADERVRNLPQVQVGDEVAVNYYESLVLRLLKPDEAAVNEASVGAARAKSGEMPAAVGGGQVTVTVSIEAIDKGAGTVTFKDPAGGLATVRARDPKNLEKIKVGDRIAITYTEALAVNVEKTKK